MRASLTGLRKCAFDLRGDDSRATIPARSSCRTKPGKRRRCISRTDVIRRLSGLSGSLGLGFRVWGWRSRGGDTMATDMDPGLWGNLPTELLQLVFSRLGGADICRLRILSKKWKRDIDIMRAEFNWDPDLWGTLPQELLRLVFSRLRVADVGRLRILSKEWKRDIDSMMGS